MASRDIILFSNNTTAIGTTSDNASQKEKNSIWDFTITKHVEDPTWPQIDLCYLWLTQTRVHGPISQSVCKKCRCRVWIKQPKNYPTPHAKQPENSKADTTNIAHVVYPRIQWHNLLPTTKVIKRHKAITTQQRIYISVRETKNERNEIKAKPWKER